MSRLVASARYFGFEAEESAIGVAVEDTVAATTGPSRLTILLDRNGEVDIKTEVAPSWCDAPDSPYVLIGAIASQSVSSDNVYLFHNTTDTRLQDRLARKHPDADVVFLVNQREEVAGSLAGNVIVDLDGRWVTPPLSCGAVGCSFRAELLERGEIEEGFVTRAELESAERVMLIDDIYGWRAVGMIG